MVVDDDPLVCSAVARLLALNGYEIASARSAVEAIGLFSKRPCSVVITDLRLPGQDGLSLVAELLDLEPCTSFVMVTGSNQVGRSPRGGDRSIVSILTKPWDDDELLAAVRHACDLHVLRRSVSLSAPPRERILLVEDDEGYALRVEELLVGAGFEVRWVTRLKEALEVLRFGDYRAVVTELALPDARGLDCVTHLSRAAPSSAVLVLSGLCDDVLAAQALRSGAEDYLVKGNGTTDRLGRAIRFAMERKSVEARMSELAHTDALTGVFNRAALNDHLRRALARARRAQKAVSVLYLDLDRFKQINDQLGHATGDAVLQEFAARLIRSVRPYDTVGRLGGDEFAILLEDVDSIQDVEVIARRIIGAMAPPITLIDGALSIATSIGISTHPYDGSTPEALLSSADSAMYTAKRSGSNRYCCAGHAPKAA